MQKLNLFSGTILRIGLALVFLWFGIDQIIDTRSWIGYIPDWVTHYSGLQAATVVYLNGVFEIVFGTALLFGLFTRIVAFVLFLHIADITFTVGFDAIGVRDFGLTVATFVIFVQGSDFFTLDRYIQNSKNKMSTVPVPGPIDSTPLV